MYRSQAKGGTTHLHAYATVYLVRHGLHGEVLSAGLQPDDQQVHVVHRNPSGSEWG